MIDPLIRQEIRYRHSLGESERSIARVLGISRNTVHAYLTDETRGMQLRAPIKRKSILHKADQDRLVRRHLKIVQIRRQLLVLEAF